MSKQKNPATAPTAPVPVDWTGTRTQRVEYKPAATIFAQGDPATCVMYVEQGNARLSVLLHAGKEGGRRGTGRGALFRRGLPGRAIPAHGNGDRHNGVHDRGRRQAGNGAPATRQAGIRGSFPDSHADAEHPDRRRPNRQLFNSAEKRLARTLLLLSRYGEPDASHRTLPRVAQETLAEMVGTTRSRVNFFMNKFRKLGFIEYNGGLKVHNSLLSVVLRD
jgi:CRP/FNR family cyclic AMP-dependent transcriptional regulator